MNEQTITRDGGPAYPSLVEVERYRDERWVSERVPVGGATLLDYFAGKALIGILAAHAGSDAPPPDPDLLASLCFKYADAMLRERDQGRG